MAQLTNTKPISCQGFHPQKGINFFATYSPISRISSIRILLVLASINLFMYQMEMKTAFLNGDLKEEIYMHQLEGFLGKG